MKIVLASWNPEKLRWLTSGFEGLNLTVEAVDPAACAQQEEDGDTCAENAEKKARCVRAGADAIVVAEDSGLFLHGLGGFPGTHTARWALGDDDDRARLLLERLRGNRDREARFVSCVCVLFPDGGRALCEGVLMGRVPEAFRGDPGAGDGAIFELEDGATIAETGAAAVDAFNHRAKAMEAARGAIESWRNRQKFT